MDFISVVVTRSFTNKTDEFKVNGVANSRKEVTKMFESAGIAEENRFNVVKTSDVVALCGASDAERLRLIQELAGVKMFSNAKGDIDSCVKVKAFAKLQLAEQKPQQAKFD